MNRTSLQTLFKVSHKLLPLAIAYLLLQIVFSCNNSPGYLQRPTKNHPVLIQDSAGVQTKPLAIRDTTGNHACCSKEFASAGLAGNSNESYLVPITVLATAASCLLILAGYFLNRSGRHSKELKYQNLALQHKNEELQKAVISLEQTHSDDIRTMRMVAHDLKNPVSAIHNLVYSLMKKDQPEPMNEILDLIKTSCVNCMSIIKDLSNDKKNGADTRKETVDVAGLLEHSIEMLQPKADDKNQQLLLHVTHAMVVLYRQKILRLISNAIDKMIQLCPENATIKTGLVRKEDTVLISIQSDAVKITHELFCKHFHIQVQAAQMTEGKQKQDEHLTAAESIIAEHKGSMWFETLQDQGSVVYIELPYLS